KDKLIEYTKNPSLYARYFDTTDMNSETRGIVVDTPKENDQLLWHKKPNIRYAVFLIEELVDQNYASNILDKLACVQKVHNTGFVVANYLLTALQNGKLTDYLKVYVEITDN
ncbi:MAG: MerR family transcriptional regulator, partial [Oscillospiraceae bacterium]